MEEEEEEEVNNESETCWDSAAGNELVRVLLDDASSTSPLFLSSSTIKAGTGVGDEQPTVLKKILSSVYSGPTIEDIESALSMNAPDAGRSTPQPIAPSPARKGVGKMDIKYTLMIKSCGNELAEDGYKWRKYGQKTIKNSPNPRSYYKCSTPRCNAKKQVEKSKEDPEMVMITYEGLHLHYPYSHVFRRRPQGYSSAARTAQTMPKKPKNQHIHQDKPKEQSMMHQEEEVVVAIGGQSRPESDPDQVLRDQGESLLNSMAGKENLRYECLRDDVVQYQHGLLEDIVPLPVREPCGVSTASSVHPYHFFSKTSWPS